MYLYIHLQKYTSLYIVMLAALRGLVLTGQMVEGHVDQVPLGPRLVAVDVDSAQQLSPVGGQRLPRQTGECQHNAQVLPHATVECNGTHIDRYTHI